jgi:hypothetical protein
MRGPERVIPAQDSETTGLALRLVVSVFALLWGRVSLRQRELYHFEMQCMMGFP